MLLQNFLLKYFLVTVTKEQLALLQSPLTQSVFTLPPRNELTQGLDYRTETYILICAFRQVSDFAVFKPDYEINLDEDMIEISHYERDKLQESLQLYN